MRTALILVALVVVGCTTCGCRGGLFGGRMNPTGDKANGSTLKVYEFNVSPNARCVFNIGNAAAQAPMYQGGEAQGTGDGTGAPYVSTPNMPATAGANAGTVAAKFAIQTVNDGNKRTAETDAALAAALQAGVTGSNLGQTAPTAIRQSGANGTGGPGTANTTTTDTNAIQPVVPVGTSPVVTNPTNAAAGPSSTPTTTGGTGGTVTQPAPAETAPTAADLVAAEKALADAQGIASTVGTGSGTGGANTPAQQAAADAVVKAQAVLDALRAKAK